MVSINSLVNVWKLAGLVTIDDGCEKNNLIRLSQELGIEERVHFTGFVSRQNGLADIYRMADLFITTSQIETQGIVLLEAAASGLPIVAVDATCISEIVHDQINGRLVNAHDHDALSQAVITLIKHPQTAKGMGQESLILARKHAIQLTDQRHESLYTGLILRSNHQRAAITTKAWHPRSSMKTWMGIK